MGAAEGARFWVRVRVKTKRQTAAGQPPVINTHYLIGSEVMSEIMGTNSLKFE